VGEYVFDSLLWSLTASGFLNFTISNDNLPESIRDSFNLDVSSIQFIIPAMAEHYALNQTFELNCIP
jgi:hypothetical protein